MNKVGKQLILLASCFCFAGSFSACVRHVQERALKTGADLITCPASLSVPWIVDEGYSVRGCGRMVTVVCDGTNPDATCKRTGLVRPARPLKGHKAVAPSDEFQHALTSRSSSVLGCLETEKTSVMLRFRWDTSGLALVGNEDKWKPEQLECVAKALEDVVVKLPQGYTVFQYTFAVFDDPGKQSGQIVRKTEGQGGTNESGGLLGDPEEENLSAREQARVKAEEALRAMLTERSEDILTCTGVERSAIKVEYFTDGAVEVSLRDVTPDSPEEGCVRDVLKSLRMPEVGEGLAGEILHLVKHSIGSADPVPH